MKKETIKIMATQLGDAELSVEEWQSFMKKETIKIMATQLGDAELSVEEWQSFVLDLGGRSATNLRTAMRQLRNLLDRQGGQ